MAALQDQPHIAARVCDAIGKLAEGFKDYAGVFVLFLLYDMHMRHHC